MPLKFHLDEHVTRRIAMGLRLRGLDTTTSSDAGLVGVADEDQLAFAAASGRVIVTCDADFLRLHAEGVHHAGIVYCASGIQSVGEVIRILVLMSAVLEAEQMTDTIEFI